MKAWRVALGLGIAWVACVTGRARRDKSDSSPGGRLEDDFIEQVAELCMAGLECNLDASEDVRRAVMGAISSTLRHSEGPGIDAEPALNPLARLEMRIRRLDARKVERALGMMWMRKSSADRIMVADEVMWENLPEQYRKRFIKEETDQQVYLLYQRVRAEEGEG